MNWSCTSPRNCHPEQSAQSKDLLSRNILLLPTENKIIVPLPTARRSAIDLPPEGHEVIHCRNRGNQRHEVDRCHRHWPHRHDEPSKMPCIPAMRQNHRHHRHDLNHRLQLADVTCLNREPFSTGNAATGQSRGTRGRSREPQSTASQCPGNTGRGR